MTTKTLLNILLIFIIPVLCFAQNTPATDSTKIMIDKEILDLINTSETASIHLLNGWKKDRTRTGFMGYDVVDRASLTKDEISNLYAILSDAGSYTSGKYIKRCEFIPNIGVEFSSGGNAQKVLFALSCDILMLDSQPRGKKVELNRVAGENLDVAFSNVFTNYDIREVSKLIEKDPFTESIDSIDSDTPQEDTPPVSSPPPSPVDTLRENQVAPVETTTSILEATSIEEYEVKSGDSISKIARMFGVRQRDVKIWNNLENNTIHPRQKLIIYKQN